MSPRTLEEAQQICQTHTERLVKEAVSSLYSIYLTEHILFFFGSCDEVIYKPVLQVNVPFF